MDKDENLFPVSENTHFTMLDEILDFLYHCRYVLQLRNEHFEQIAQIVKSFESTFLREKLRYMQK